jgi:hypothetical protein
MRGKRGERGERGKRGESERRKSGRIHSFLSSSLTLSPLSYLAAMTCGIVQFIFVCYDSGKLHYRPLISS